MAVLLGLGLVTCILPEGTPTRTVSSAQENLPVPGSPAPKWSRLSSRRMKPGPSDRTLLIQRSIAASCVGVGGLLVILPDLVRTPGRL